MIDTEFEARMLAAAMTTADDVVWFYLRIALGIGVGMFGVVVLMSLLVGRKKG